MKHDSVDRVLHFMGHATRDAAAGREAPRHFDFVADPPHRFGVAHDDQSADLRILLLHEIQRHLYALSAGYLEFTLRHGPAALKRVKQGRTEQRISGEYLLHATSQQFSARAAKEGFDGSADQDNSRIARE